MSSYWTLDQIEPQQDKRFLITGANSGIGFHTALELARRGGVVLMACRDRARGQAALDRLRKEALGPLSAASEAELVVLDLASLASVWNVAQEQLARKLPIHCLINNAGVMAPPKRLLTQDGFELQFGTNVLGHFALTCLLMPLLEQARSARVEDAPRIVTIASIAHKRGCIDFDDLQSAKHYNPMQAYAQTKLADLMFTFELERRLRTETLGSISVAAHPGVANTQLFQSADHAAAERQIRKVVGHLIGFFLNSEAQGALPTLYAATAEGVQGGDYYGPTGMLEMRGMRVGAAQVAPQALDQTAQQRLWEICEKLTGTSLPLTQ